MLLIIFHFMSWKIDDRILHVLTIQIICYYCMMILATRRTWRYFLKWFLWIYSIWIWWFRGSRFWWIWHKFYNDRVTEHFGDIPWKKHWAYFGGHPYLANSFPFRQFFQRRLFVPEDDLFIDISVILKL